MLDVHPPHSPTHTWKDFFIHIATIVVGLLIAVGLEQTVEAIHHRREVAELNEQMRVEAENNLPLLRDSIARLETQDQYVRKLQQNLRAGKVSGANVAVVGVAPPASSILYVSPSRATWASAQTAGIAALLPAGQAKVYARLDYNALAEVGAEDFMIQQLQQLASACFSANYDHVSSAVSLITSEHRDDILFKLATLENAVQLMLYRLSILEGGDEAIAAGVESLDAMFPYQDAALSRVKTASSLNTFFGTDPGQKYTNKPVAAGSK